MNNTENTTQKLDSVITAQGLTKIFKDFWGRPKAKAVDGIDFSVPQGTVFGLLGPNGSGKSTTVKMLLGLLHPTRGALSVLGKTPRNVDTKRHVGYLPEETYLYHYLTAAESLDFFGALFAMPATERKRRIKQLLDMVGLTPSANRPVGEFSKGMARRIGLAQALINDPDLVILDEPTTGLDPIGCREVKNVIRLLAERGKTVILCSHLLADVQDVCDQVAVMYGGKIYAYGNLSDMLTIEDKTTITAPTLDEDTLQDVITVLRKRIEEDKLQIDQPKMNLEDLFLNVVEQARREQRQTAGAEAGGKVASYLQEETAESESARQREKLLQDLTAEEKQAQTTSETQELQRDKQKQESATRKKLEQFATEEDKDGTANREKSEDVQKTQEDELKNRAESEEKLKNILGDKNKK